MHYKKSPKAVDIIDLIERQTRVFQVPSVTEIAFKKDPYLVLISCILSLRTKDKVSLAASYRLFKKADKPGEVCKLDPKQIEKLIYPVGFYHKKAVNIVEISRSLIKDFSGKVPNRLEDLLSLKGVGRKTANLVLGLGFDIPAICVDTHVHRIPNRIGIIRTDTPFDTESDLMKIIPKKMWIKLNTILVKFGQNICLAVSPLCSQCMINKFCFKKGVDKCR